MLTWREIFRQIAAHRGRLLQANLIALLAVVAAVPVPLLLPLMVDEVLLHHPGAFVAAIPSSPNTRSGRAPTQSSNGSVNVTGMSKKYLRAP